MDFNLRHDEKAASPIEVTEPGMEIDLKDKHPVKAFSPIDANEFDRFTVDSDMHSPKA